VSALPFGNPLHSCFATTRTQPFSPPSLLIHFPFSHRKFRSPHPRFARLRDAGHPGITPFLPPPRSPTLLSFRFPGPPPPVHRSDLSTPASLEVLNFGPHSRPLFVVGFFWATSSATTSGLPFNKLLVLRTKVRSLFRVSTGTMPPNVFFNYHLLSGHLQTWGLHLFSVHSDFCFFRLLLAVSPFVFPRKSHLAQVTSSFGLTVFLFFSVSRFNALLLRTLAG